MRQFIKDLWDRYELQETEVNNFKIKVIEMNEGEEKEEAMKKWKYLQHNHEDFFHWIYERMTINEIENLD